MSLAVLNISLKRELKKELKEIVNDPKSRYNTLSSLVVDCLLETLPKIKEEMRK